MPFIPQFREKIVNLQAKNGEAITMSHYQEITFTKMHGLGNDYAYIVCLDKYPDNIPELSREMSDRHFGVGADGIILLCPPTTQDADFQMRIFNADGSEAKMCGNGVRCISKLAYDNNICRKSPLRVQTLSGVKEVFLETDDSDEVTSATVDMGCPTLTPSEIPVVCDGDTAVEMLIRTKTLGDIKVTAVSMGNPHGVVFVESLDAVPFYEAGAELEVHPVWPDRANIEFVEVIDRDHIKVRVWERGSGETLACGTGACASAVASVLTGRCDRKVKVELPGGTLDIEWNKDGNHVIMRGPATTVYTGTYLRKD